MKQLKMENLVMAEPLASKKHAAVLEAVAKMVTRIRAAGYPVVRLHSDCGGEFMSKGLRKWCALQSIYKTTGEPDVPQTRGRIENAVGRVKGLARSLLQSQPDLPITLWPHAVRHAAERLWRISMAALGKEMPPLIPFGTKVVVRQRSWSAKGKGAWKDKVQDARVLAPALELSRGYYVETSEGEGFVTSVLFQNVQVAGQPGSAVVTECEPVNLRRRVTGKQPPPEEPPLVRSLQDVPDEESHDPLALLMKEDQAAAALAAQTPWDRDAVVEFLKQTELRKRTGSSRTALNGGAQFIFGACRHGGVIGTSGLTGDLPGFTAFVVRLIREVVPAHHFTSVALGYNTRMDVHRDLNNQKGSRNVVVPLCVPKTGGEVWVQARQGDVLRGQPQVQVAKGQPLVGQILPWTDGYVTLDPNAWRMVMPWKVGQERIVLVAYSVGAWQAATPTLKGQLEDLGFPLPSGARLVDPVGRGGVGGAETGVAMKKNFQATQSQEPGAEVVGEVCWCKGYQVDPSLCLCKGLRESPLSDSGGPLNPLEVSQDECQGERGLGDEDGSMKVVYAIEELSEEDPADFYYSVGTRGWDDSEKPQTLLVDSIVEALDRKQVMLSAILWAEEDRLAQLSADRRDQSGELEVVERTVLSLEKDVGELRTVIRSMRSHLDEDRFGRFGADVLPPFQGDRVGEGSKHRCAMMQTSADSAETDKPPQDHENSGIPDEFLTSRSVTLQEVQENLDEWIEPLRDEVNALEYVHEAVESVTERELQDLEKKGFTIERIPGRGVFVVKAGTGRKRARIVACGNYLDPSKGVSAGGVESHSPTLQKYSTFAAGLDTTAFRAQLRMAALNKWSAAGLDVKTAFLRAPLGPVLQERHLIAVKPPAILVRAGIVKAGTFWLVRKAVYGLAPAPKAWSTYRDGELRQKKWTGSQGGSFEFRPMYSDPSLWEVLCSGQVVGHLGVYVDDLLITGSRYAINEVIQAVRSLWETSEPEWIDEPGGLTFLGVQVRRTAEGDYVLNEVKYARELLSKYPQVQAGSWVPMLKEDVGEPEQHVTAEDHRRAQGIHR